MNSYLAKSMNLQSIFEKKFFSSIFFVLVRRIADRKCFLVETKDEHKAGHFLIPKLFWLFLLKSSQDVSLMMLQWFIS
jgi:hypothetical protein